MPSCSGAPWAASAAVVRSDLVPGAAPARCMVAAGGGNRRMAGAYPTMPPMGTGGTRAIDVARRAGVTYTLHEYAHDARSTLHEGGRGYALEAVDALGLDAARVFKTIVVSVDGRLGLAVVPADAEVDLKAAADALGGRRAAIASPTEAERATGYVLGGISPLGTRRPLP